MKKAIIVIVVIAVVGFGLFFFKKAKSAEKKEADSKTDPEADQPATPKTALEKVFGDIKVNEPKISPDYVEGKKDPLAVAAQVLNNRLDNKEKNDPSRFLDYVYDVLTDQEKYYFDGAIKVTDHRNSPWLENATFGARINNIPLMVAHYLNLLNNNVQQGFMSQERFNVINAHAKYMYQ